MAKKVFVLFFIAISCCQVYSQTKGFSGLDQEKIFQEEAQSVLNSSDKMLNAESMIFGDVVEPDYYKLGPGDVLGYSNLTASSSALQHMVVSPECSIFIPRVGELSVKNMTITQAKNAVIERVKQQQANAIITLSLSKPRKVFVSLSGNTLSTGMYSLPASYRISTAISAINKMAESDQKQPMIQYSYEKSLDKKRKMESRFNNGGLGGKIDYSGRTLSVIRKDGSTVSADLEKARINNDVSLDPYIQENDNIVIPFNNDNISFISVSGAVNRPCMIPWKNGDKVSELIRMAGGFTSNADYSNISLTSPTGSSIKLNYNVETNLFSEDIELGEGYGITIGSKENQKNSKQSAFVSVTGEVNKPGIYQIIEGETKLKDIIEQAGGFTSEAYLPLANVFRAEGIAEVSKFDDSFQEFFRTSDLTMEDSSRVKNNIHYSLPIVSCNFADLYVNNSESDNVKLKTGDLVSVPKCPKTIYVFGYVNKPGYVDYEPGKTLEWYLNRVGGVTKGGKQGRARIIRGNNNTWIEGDDKVFVYAGDKIFVPTSPDLPPGTEIQTYSLLISGVFALISIASLIFQITKDN